MLSERRREQLSREATPPRERWVTGVPRPGKPAFPGYAAPPKKGNKYILSGPDANTRDAKEIRKLSKKEKQK